MKHSKYILVICRTIETSMLDAKTIVTKTSQRAVSVSQAASIVPHTVILNVTMNCLNYNDLLPAQWMLLRKAHQYLDDVIDFSWYCSVTF